MTHKTWMTAARGLLAILVGLGAWLPGLQTRPRAVAQANGPIRLTQDLEPGETIGEYGVSPSGNCVVYWVSTSLSGLSDLYAASTTEGEPVKLTPTPLVSLWQVLFAGDDRVIYWIRGSGLDGTDELFTVPATGGTPTSLLPVISTRRDIQQVAVSPDGRQVIVAYDVSSPANSTYNLYILPADGSGAPQPLNGPLATGGRVNPGWVISRHGPRVIYAASERSSDAVELFSRRLDRSDAGPLVLNATLPTGAGVRAAFSSFGNNPSFFSVLALTPDGQRVVFMVDAVSFCCGQPTAPTHLFVARVDVAGTAARLNRDGQALW